MAHNADSTPMTIPFGTNRPAFLSQFRDIAFDSSGRDIFSSAVDPLKALHESPGKCFI